MEDIIKKYQPIVSEFLLNFLKRKESEYKQINPWALDFCQRLQNFVIKGKMARPALVCFSYEMFDGKLNQEIIKAASAIQIIHSGFLIHDDIIDRDPRRYNQPTIYTQYINLADDLKLPDTYHFGESMGICVGIAAYFLATELLASVEVASGIMSKLIKFYSQQSQLVGAGEMQDVFLAYTQKSISEEDIMPVLRDKTARYTLSIPLCAGAILADRTQEEINLLDKIGEHIGMIFQIRDDELGVFGNPDVTGKPVGADIREGKKTLLYLYLFQNAPKSDHPKLKSLFGKPDLTQQEVEFARQQMRQAKVPEKIQEKVNHLRQNTLPLIEQLSVSESNKQKLIKILEFCATRQK